MDREHDSEAHNAHDIDRDAVCQGCVCAVASALDMDIQNGEEEFDEGFGDLLDYLHDAVAAIHRARREQWTSKHDAIANSWEAATTLVRIAVAVQRTIARGRDISRN